MDRLAYPGHWRENNDKTEDVLYEYKITFAYFMSSIYNMMKSMHNLFEDSKYFSNYVKRNKLYSVVKAYNSCRDSKDLDSWVHKYGMSLKSNPVRPLEKTISIEDFFN